MTVTLLQGDCRAILRNLPTGRFRTCVTSPPYWHQRLYLPEGHPYAALEIGREPTPEAYTQAIVDVFREVRRTLADDGTLWINLGTCFARKSSSGSLVGSTLTGSQRAQMAYRGSAPGKTAAVRATQSGRQGRVYGQPPGWQDKELIPLPWMLGLALHADGWLLRMDNIWAPPSAMPESVTDRPTHAHEYVLLLTKGPHYFFNADAIRQPHRMRAQRRPNGHKPLRREGQPEHTWSTTARAEPDVDGNPLGRNCRSVWDDINTEPSDGSHVAPMPSALARRCILAGSARGDHVLDPFGGGGTVGRVAAGELRHATLIDLDERAVDLARGRTNLLDFAAAGGAS